MGMSKLRVREAELARSRPILMTVHGSHLYGLAGPDSDLDTYQVVLGCSKNFIWNRNSEVDAVHIHLSGFQDALTNGTPQALEALFAPFPMIRQGWPHYFAGLRPGIDNARAAYRRTVHNFIFNNGGRTGAAAERINPLKLRRHALRLTYNLNDLVSTGRFNPQLSPNQATRITEQARVLSDNTIIRYLESALMGRL